MSERKRRNRQGQLSCEPHCKSAQKMKLNLSRLSKRYEAALRLHLKQHLPANFQSARGLGRQALSIGLETLDVARMHEIALAALEASSTGDGILKRAEAFFIEAITPIEDTHRAALKTNARLSELKRTLGRRTVDLAASNRSLRKGISRRKTVEKALKERGESAKELLQEAHDLQKQLQRLTRQILSTQEENRKKMSQDLREEIAQTLLGISVQLSTLKKEAEVNTERFNKEIASTQSVVNKSVKSINGFLGEFERRHDP